MSKLIRIVLATLLLCLSAAAQTETKNDLGLSLGAGLVPSRTTASGQPVNFGASIAFSADYARLIKNGKTSLYAEFPFVAEPANSVRSTNLQSIVSLASIYVVPSLRVQFVSGAGNSPWLSGGFGYGIREGSEFFGDGRRNGSRYQSDIS